MCKLFFWGSEAHLIVRPGESMSICGGSPCVYEIPVEDASARFALKMRIYLMDRDPDPETKRRMVHAAHLLETGRTFGEFKKFGPITLAEMKYRYVAHVVEQEETFRAAGRLLDIDPATACRIFNSGRDGDKSMFETIPVDRLSPKPNNGTG